MTIQEERISKIEISLELIIEKLQGTASFENMIIESIKKIDERMILVNREAERVCKLVEMQIMENEKSRIGIRDDINDILSSDIVKEISKKLVNKITHALDL